MKTLCYLTLALTLIIMLIAIWSPVYKDEFVVTFFAFSILSSIALSVLLSSGFTEIDEIAKQKRK